jgi:hypothetical protein
MTRTKPKFVSVDYQKYESTHIIPYRIFTGIINLHIALRTGLPSSFVIFLFFLAHFPYFEKKRSRLMRSCCCVCVSLSIVIRQQLGKSPLSLLGNGSVETLPR